MYRTKPSTVGVGVGVFGVAFTVLTTALLVLVPQELLTPATSRAYIEAWSRPIMTIGQAVMVYGLPLVSAVYAYYLRRSNHAARSVLVGFVVGGLVLGFGDALVTEAVTHFFAEDPAIGRSVVTHAFRIASLTGRLVGGALVGVLVATVVELSR